MVHTRWRSYRRQELVSYIMVSGHQKKGRKRNEKGLRITGYRIIGGFFAGAVYSKSDIGPGAHAQADAYG